MTFCSNLSVRIKTLALHKAGLKGFILSLALLLTVQGCSVLPAVPGMSRITGEDGVFRDRQGEYLEAETIVHTEIPAGLDGYIIDDLLIIPEPTAIESSAFLEVPRPRVLVGNSDREVIIQRIEGLSWIIVDASPSQVWPRIRDYWTQNSIDLAFESPTQGVLDTGWFVLEGNLLTKEKFRVSVEPGFQDNSSEIRLKHMSIAQATPTFGQVNWPEESMDADIEYDMIAALASYLADVADLYQASSVSFLAGAISNDGKASIARTPAGTQLLRLEADYSRGWAAVGRALRRADIEIVAQSQELGIYEVRYLVGEVLEEDSPGFFKRVVTLNGAFSGEDEVEEFYLKIQLLNTGDVIEVLVDNLDGRESAEINDAENSLLRVIRNTIA